MYETSSGRAHCSTQSKSLLDNQLGKFPKREENTKHGVSPPIVYKP
jgi:hypothetical protein